MASRPDHSQAFVDRSDDDNIVVAMPKRVKREPGPASLSPADAPNGRPQATARRIPAHSNLTLPTLNSLTNKTSRPIAGSIPRPRNSFMLWRQSSGLAPKASASAWASLDPVVKEHFERLAVEEKARHLAVHPRYQFRPGKIAQSTSKRKRKEAQANIASNNLGAEDRTVVYDGSSRAERVTPLFAAVDQVADEQREEMEKAAMTSPTKAETKDEVLGHHAEMNSMISLKRSDKRVRFAPTETAAKPLLSSPARTRAQLLAKLSTPLEDLLQAQRQSADAEEEGNREDEAEDIRETTNSNSKHAKCRGVAQQAEADHIQGTANINAGDNKRQSSASGCTARVDRETDLVMPTTSRARGSSPRPFQAIVRSLINHPGTTTYFQKISELRTMPLATAREEREYLANPNPQQRPVFSGFPTVPLPGGYHSPAVDAFWEAFLARQARDGGVSGRKHYAQEERPLVWTIYLALNNMSHYFDEDVEQEGVGDGEGSGGLNDG